MQDTLPHIRIVRIRRPASADLLVASVFAAMILIAGYQRTDLEHIRMQSKKFEQNVSSEAELLRMRDSLGIQNHLASAFIPPATRSQAEAALIAQVRRLLLNSDAEIGSIAITHGANSSVENRVRLHASARLKPLDLDRLIQNLLDHQPYLFITSAAINSSDSLPPNLHQYEPDLIEVTFTLEAFRLLEND